MVQAITHSEGDAPAVARDSNSDQLSALTGDYQYGDEKYTPRTGAKLPVDEAVLTETLAAKPEVRQKFFRLISTGAGATALAFLLAACAPNGAPIPTGSQASEATPSPETTVPAEAFDATKFDIPATATDQEIGQRYANLTTVEFTSGLSAKALTTEYENRSNFSQTQDDFANTKATEVIDAIFREQYVKGWENVSSLANMHRYYINQCAIRIKLLLITSNNSLVFSEQFTLNGIPSLKDGIDSHQKIASIVLTETNNAQESAAKNLSDNSFQDINNTTSTSTVTYVIVDGRLRIADEVSKLNR